MCELLFRDKVTQQVRQVAKDLCNTQNFVPRIIERSPQFYVPHLHHEKSILKI